MSAVESNLLGRLSTSEQDLMQAAGLTATAPELPAAPAEAVVTDTAEAAEVTEEMIAEAPVAAEAQPEVLPETEDSAPISTEEAKEREAKIASLLQRLNRLASSPEGTPGASGEKPEVKEFVPSEPRTMRDTKLTDSEVESLVMKYLLAKGDAPGRGVADQIKLPFLLVEELLRRLKNDQVVAYRDSAPMGDYVYQLTDVGRERARRLMDQSTYYGSAPVPLSDYEAAVKAQSLETQHPTQEDLKRAFSDLLINPQMLDRLGPAINSGRGMFLFGAPGNGKTSIAERVTKAFGQYIWIPRALSADGEVIRLFDPMNHEEAPLDRGDGLLDQTKVDKRWIRIKRPTIVVGGELTMEHLEVQFNAATGTSEAPVQLKSNCGTLVIDDFGRQKMTTDQLLNRWIVPLEKRWDFLNLSSGRKIQVPFDQLVIFSTNLEPKDLVDEAFLRRIPYKIEVVDQSEEAFRKLFTILCPKLGIEFSQPAVDYLIQNHYKAVNRPMRSCQPRDLLLQVRNHCFYQGRPAVLSPEAFDFAVSNYFAVL